MPALATRPLIQSRRAAPPRERGALGLHLGFAARLQPADTGGPELCVALQPTLAVLRCGPVEVPLDLAALPAWLAVHVPAACSHLRLDAFSRWLGVLAARVRLGAPQPVTVPQTVPPSPRRRSSSTGRYGVLLPTPGATSQHSSAPSPSLNPPSSRPPPVLAPPPRPAATPSAFVTPAPRGAELGDWASEWEGLAVRRPALALPSGAPPGPPSASSDSRYFVYAPSDADSDASEENDAQLAAAEAAAKAAAVQAAAAIVRAAAATTAASAAVAAAVEGRGSPTPTPESTPGVVAESSPAPTPTASPFPLAWQPPAWQPPAAHEILPGLEAFLRSIAASGVDMEAAVRRAWTPQGGSPAVPLTALPPPSPAAARALLEKRMMSDDDDL